MTENDADVVKSDEVTAEHEAPVTEDVPVEETSVQEDFAADNKPYSRASKRIQQLNAAKKEAIADAEAARAENLRLKQRLEQIEQRQSQIDAKVNEPAKQGLEKYSNEELATLEAAYLDPNSQDFSVPMAVKVRDELTARQIADAVGKHAGEIQQEREYTARVNKVWNETKAELGELGRELDDPNSALFRAADAKYKARLVANQGVTPDPLWQKLSVYEAVHEMNRTSADAQAQREVERERKKARTRDAISAGGEAAVNEANSIRARLAKGDFKGALAESPLVRGMVEDVSVYKRR